MFTTNVLNVLLLSSSAAFAATFDVQVGGASFVFTPNNVQAAVGDTISFHFNPKNHSVTQSTLANPCVPLVGGVTTNFVPVAAGTAAADLPVANLTITDASKPMWFFCEQTGHCQSGMIFAVNPGNEFAAFQAAATGSSASSTASSAQSTASSTGTSTSAASTSTSTSTNHLVTVGDNSSLLYSPSNIQANIGDTITFEFRAKNHTATQSTFANPCKKIASTSTSGQSGFDSGFMPVSTGGSFPQFTITVNDTTPIWVYCAQTNPVSHCGKGMVFAANAPTSGNTFDAFQQAAESSANASSTSTTSSSNPSSTGADVRLSTGAALAVSIASAIFALML